MSPKEIKRRLRVRDLTQEKVAKRLRLSQTAANFVINRKLVIEKHDRRLAKLIECSFEELRGIPTGEESNPPDQAA